jgi:serine/threonine protein phosphatase PrpC
VTKIFNKLFGREKQPLETIDTDQTAPAPIPVTDEVATKPLAKLPDLPVPEIGIDQLDGNQLAASSSQSVGLQRDHNEDALFCLTTTLASNDTNLPFGLYIVADGMGGHQHGEIASDTAIRAMAEHVIRKLFLPIFSASPHPPEESLQETLQNGVRAAHSSILKNVSGGGTTLTTVLILGNQMAIAHVGDSRIYSVDPEGTMQPLTRDHSLVRRLEELGQLTPEEAAIHPQRNVLYRALGQGEPFEPEIITAPIPHAGYLLICSDGLWGVVPDEDMSRMILTASSLQNACHDMVMAANAAGGPDNITAILVRLPSIT